LNKILEHCVDEMESSDCSEAPSCILHRRIVE